MRDSPFKRSRVAPPWPPPRRRAPPQLWPPPPPRSPPLAAKMAAVALNALGFVSSTCSEASPTAGSGAHRRAAIAARPRSRPHGRRKRHAVRRSAAAVCRGVARPRELRRHTIVSPPRVFALGAPLGCRPFCLRGGRRIGRGHRRRDDAGGAPVARRLGGRGGVRDVARPRAHVVGCVRGERHRARARRRPRQRRRVLLRGHHVLRAVAAANERCQPAPDGSTPPPPRVARVRPRRPRRLARRPLARAGALLALCVGKASAERWAAALRRARRRWCGRWCGGGSGAAPREGTAAAARAARAAAGARRRAPLCGVAGWVALLGLVVPPIVYWRAVLPCVECFDFEAALTHEVGHVLGLGHPDEAASSASTSAPCRRRPPRRRRRRWRRAAVRSRATSTAARRRAGGRARRATLWRRRRPTRAARRARDARVCPLARRRRVPARRRPRRPRPPLPELRGRRRRRRRRAVRAAGAPPRLAAPRGVAGDPVGTIGALLCVASTLHARRRRRREALEHTQEVQTLRGALGNARRASAAVQAQHELWLSAMSADLQHSGSPGGRSRDLWHSALTATDLSGTRFASSRASTQGSRRSTQSGASAPRGAALAEMSTVAEASGAAVLTRTAPPGRRASTRPAARAPRGAVAADSQRAVVAQNAHPRLAGRATARRRGEAAPAPGDVAESCVAEEMSTTVRQSHAVV